MSRLGIRMIPVGAALLITATSGSALTVTCGMTIPAGSGKVVLESDLTCTDNFTAAVTVEGPGTVLDLGQHSIDGNDHTTYAVELSGSEAVVRNGTVKGFQSAGVLVGGSAGVVSKLVVTGGSTAIDVTGGSGNTIVGCSAIGQNVNGVRTTAPGTILKSNQTNCPGIGYFIDGGADNSILTGNTAARANTAGFHFAADGIIATKNSAIANETGFEVVAGSGVVLKKNSSIGNGGIGFSLDASGVTLEKNEAKGNSSDGISVFSSNNTLKKNSATLNGNDGIRVIVGPTGNVFSGNSASGNTNLDLDDEADCGGSIWSSSKYGTSSNACIQ